MGSAPAGLTVLVSGSTVLRVRLDTGQAIDEFPCLAALGLHGGQIGVQPVAAWAGRLVNVTEDGAHTALFSPSRGAFESVQGPDNAVGGAGDPDISAVPDIARGVLFNWHTPAGYSVVQFFAGQHVTRSVYITVDPTVTAIGGVQRGVVAVRRGPNGAPARLELLDPVSGLLRKPLATLHGGWPILQGQRLAWVPTPCTVKCALHVLDLRTGTERIEVLPRTIEGGPAELQFSPRGDQVAVSAVWSYDPFGPGQVYVLRPDGSWAWVSGLGSELAPGITWADDRRLVVAASQDDAQTLGRLLSFGLWDSRSGRLAALPVSIVQRGPVGAPHLSTVSGGLAGW